MKRSSFFALFFGIILTVTLLLIYLSASVKLTELRLELPQENKELKEILERNTSLQYEIDRLENPARLMQLMRQPEFSHLKYPLESEVIVIPDARDNES